MASLGEFIQQADWKKEKHAPVIVAPEAVKAGEAFTVEVSVGKEIAHPHTTEHHIAWIALYFQPADGKFTYRVGQYEFSAHGEAAAGPNQGPVYAEPVVTASVKLNKPGTLLAVALCNIHGLWESSQPISVS